VVRRSAETLAALEGLRGTLKDPDSSNVDQQPEYVGKLSRSIKDELLVLVGLCTHLGCAPKYRPEVGAADLGGDSWLGGFFCPCHGSKFDLSGRVHKSMPAPSNLEVPPYYFASDNKIIVGEDGEKS
jgi:ubiquinol-cytochrome c reductase iron-sulfur subunit